MVRVECIRFLMVRLIPRMLMWINVMRKDQLSAQGSIFGARKTSEDARKILEP